MAAPGPGDGRVRATFLKVYRRSLSTFEPVGPCPCRGTLYSYTGVSEEAGARIYTVPYQGHLSCTSLVTLKPYLRPSPAHSGAPWPTHGSSLGRKRRDTEPEQPQKITLHSCERMQFVQQRTLTAARSLAAEGRRAGCHWQEREYPYTPLSRRQRSMPSPDSRAPCPIPIARPSLCARLIVGHLGGQHLRRQLLSKPRLARVSSRTAWGPVC